MEPSNHTRVTDFIMQGLFDHPQPQGLIFGLFLCLYMTAIMGNSLIIVAIVLHPPLHTPMYFFIANLALVDILCTSSVLLKMLENLLQEEKIISFGGCMAQLFVFTLSSGTELVRLAAMSYDRYVAICHPLHYVNLLSKEICISLAASAWAVGTINSLVHTLLMLHLDFCGPNLIQHFFCEIPPVLALSCSSTYLNEIMIFMADIFLAMGNFLLTTMSYSFIIIAILKIRSSKGKQRAFSTCSSHMLVVILYYSTIIYTYIRPTSSYSLDKDKVVAIIYTLVTPTLNPLIYSLRNNEVKVAIRKILPFTTKLQFFQE
ncbi:olfactory receptor 13G1-like [Lepidochelys kempii]|uniref:olfactory receptor 13G1-like n=1 Tax=Lepidochelys kempii TaxID=8472 RepID=UPI003C6F6420